MVNLTKRTKKDDDPPIKNRKAYLEQAAINEVNTYFSPSARKNRAPADPSEEESTTIIEAIQSPQDRSLLYAEILQIVASACPTWNVNPSVFLMRTKRYTLHEIAETLGLTIHQVRFEIEKLRHHAPSLLVKKLNITTDDPRSALFAELLGEGP